MERMEHVYVRCSWQFFELALLTAFARLLYREIGCNFLCYKLFQQRQ